MWTLHMGTRVLPCVRPRRCLGVASRVDQPSALVEKAANAGRSQTYHSSSRLVRLAILIKGMLWKNGRNGTNWEAYGRGSLPLHNLVSDSAHPHYVSDRLPQSFVGSS